MKPAFILAAALTLAAPVVFAASGYQTRTVSVAHRSQPLDLHIWYPTDLETTNRKIGKNAAFVGVAVAFDAPPSVGSYPLVLLSHGSGGNAVNIAWIAIALAERGMVVIAPDHPGTTSRDSIPREMLKIWQRPADFSAILDYAEHELANELSLDMRRVGVVGFSLGGNTALALAGARADHRAYVRYCDNFPEILDCAWFRAAGVDLAAIDTARFEQSNVDPRIKAVVAIDPALAQAYQPASLGQIGMPVQIINLGDAQTVPAGINGQTISGFIAGVDYQSVAEATHFSFLGLCTEIGEAIIASEGEDPICSEAGTRGRDSIHRELEQLIGEFLKKAL